MEDIDLLIDAGFDIEFIKSPQNQYHVISRDFDIAKLKVLIDAVVSSKFISKARSQALAYKLSKLAGPYEAKDLVRNIAVERRVKGDNKQLLLIIDTINTAINEKKKIAFKYFTYDVRKDKKKITTVTCTNLARTSLSGLATIIMLLDFRTSVMTSAYFAKIVSARFRRCLKKNPSLCQEPLT